MTTASARFAVSDVHGHPDRLVAALAEVGLVGDQGSWTGGSATLWFLGDYVDRGPDGVGVIDTVMRLRTEAEEAGGRVGALLGNHEVLALGMHDFGAQPVSGRAGERVSFGHSWLINGGRPHDQERLTDAHLEWLRALPAIALDGDDLLVHSDTLAYLEWGRDIASINAAVTADLCADELAARWACWSRMTTRFAFDGEDGEAQAEHLLSVLGGTRVVHGHSPITVLTGTPPEEVTGPYAYASGRALAIDGGLYAGGPCLVVPLGP